MIESVTQGFEIAQGEIRVVAATTRRQLHAFVELPYTLYAGDPRWVPPLRRDEYRRLSPRHNPFFDHGTIDLFLAIRGGQVTGRIAAVHDALHDTTHNERVTWFGFFEARDEATAARLLETVEQRARARGSLAVRGPANPSLNESAGLLVRGFDDDPYLLMPYNPPRYASFIEAAGYAKAKDLLAWDLDATVPLGARIARLADRAARRHRIRVRPANMKAFDRDLQSLKTIYRAAWAGNWGFVPPTDREIDQLAADLRPVVDPEIALFAEIEDRPVAFAVAIPDLNQVLKKMRGKLLPFGVVHFLRRRAIVNRARVLLLGVLPELRRNGLYPLLVSEIHRRGVARGYKRAELSWTLEDNAEINAGIEASGGRPYKTYRLYDKPLG